MAVNMDFQSFVDEVMDKKIYCHTRQGEQMTLFDIFEDEERNYYNAEN